MSKPTKVTPRAKSTIPTPPGAPLKRSASKPLAAKAVKKAKTIDIVDDVPPPTDDASPIHMTPWSRDLTPDETTALLAVEGYLEFFTSNPQLTFGVNLVKKDGPSHGKAYLVGFRPENKKLPIFVTFLDEPKPLHPLKIEEFTKDAPAPTASNDVNAAVLAQLESISARLERMETLLNEIQQSTAQAPQDLDMLLDSQVFQ